jgi:uncharacterized protein YjbI with pentapeptide repeats
VADQEAVTALLEGPEAWRHYRAARATGAPVDLRDADLRGAIHWGADLHDVDLDGATLADADFSGSNFSRANLAGAVCNGVNLNGSNLSGVKLTGARCRKASFNESSLRDAAADNADFSHAQFRDADLTGARLTQALLVGTQLPFAKLRRADLRLAVLTGVDLTEADLSGADLREADLAFVYFGKVSLRDADISKANLTGVTFLNTDLRGAKLRGCSVYGVSVWDADLEGAEQEDLIVSGNNEPRLTTDRIDVAQFIHLMIRNRNLRALIDAVATKTVLILGRFSDGRVGALHEIRQLLRARGWVPVVFDFAGPTSRDTSETVSALAHLARFVIADLTDPRSVPQELTRIIPMLPSLPIQPIIQASQEPWSMFSDLRRYPWVLEPYHYESIESLLAALETRVVAPAESKAKELTGR